MQTFQGWHLPVAIVTTAEETKAVVEGSLAYYGTYTVSDWKNLSSFTLRAVRLNQVGTVQKRLITSITSDEMNVLIRRRL